MSPDNAWAIVAGILGSVVLLAVALRSGRSTDQTTILTAAQAFRSEGDRKLEAAWESRLAQKVEVIEELKADLTEALERLAQASAQIEVLTQKVTALTSQVEALGGVPHDGP